jgi:hypothetical protein
MSHLSNSGSRRRSKPAARAAAVLSVLLLACLGLAACGSSSGSSSSTTSASASTTGTSGSPGAPGAAGAAGAAGARSGRFAAVRECLQKNGITLPQRTPGQGRPPGGAGGFPGGAAGPQLPKGVTRAQYEAALKKCGGGNFAGRAGGARIKNHAFQTALAKFASCLRENGINVPVPNTSGNGPVFDTKGINTSSAQFKAAEVKCQPVLRAAFRQGAVTGGAGAAPGSHAPGAPGGETTPAG